jgi:hypothetical protein
VVTKYGMLMPGESKTETPRFVFVIDDKQVGEPLFKVRSSLRELTAPSSAIRRCVP